MIGIMAAMTEEIDKLITELRSSREAIDKGNRTYHMGTLWGTPVVLVFSRWGKVAAATTATHLITEFKVNEIIFTGVAGGVLPQLNVGDIVVGSRLYQHDMNAQPLFEEFEIPLLGVKAFETSVGNRKTATDASQIFLNKKLQGLVAKDILNEFGIDKPKVVEADIASGDKFFASTDAVLDLNRRLPSVACVEMEGAAVAQVCFEYSIPFTIIRVVSDSANESAKIDFVKFIKLVASEYTHGILEQIFKLKHISHGGLS